MKRNIVILFATALLAAGFAPGCSQKEELGALQSHVDSLKVRVEALEDVISLANKNAYAVRVLANTHLMVETFKEDAQGVELHLSDGSTLNIWYGADVIGIVPIVGVDASGAWICSLDGGKTFSKIAGADGAFDEFGLTPLIGIDATGFWTMSLDGGETYTRMLSAEGTPISATDPRQAAGLYSFFSNVEYNDETGNLEFTLKTGDHFEIPLVGEFYILVDGFTQGTQIKAGESVTFTGVKAHNVQAAIWNNLPQGWNARMTTDELIITAPAAAPKGSYTLTLLVTGTNGGFRSYDFTLTLS